MRARTTDDGRGRTRRPRGLRIAAVLGLLALVPLVGTTAVTWQDVRNSHDAEHVAAEVQRLAEQAVDLAKLDAAVSDELDWSAIHALLGPLGLPDSLVAASLHTDPKAQLANARARVDRLIDISGRRDVAVALRDIRTTSGALRDVLPSYFEVSRSIETPMRDLFHRLTTTRTPVAGDLLEAVGVLRAAAETRASITLEMVGYFATVFDVRDAPADEITNLIELRAAYSQGMIQLDQAAVSDPSLHLALDALANGRELDAFNRAVNTLITNSLAAGVPAQGKPVTAPALLAYSATFAPVFSAATAANSRSLVILDAAARQVQTVGAQMRTAAQADIRRWWILIGLLSTLTLLVAVLATRYIVTPLRRLQRAADDLRGDALAPFVCPGGPVEVKATAFALRGAADHFDLVTRQARALASGDLEATVLDESAVGGLGLALQDAVGRLRDALASQDEFRRRLAHEAAHDGLTQIPNRTASMAQLGRSLARTNRSGSTLAVLFIDLDNFKDVNDHHGHHAGDTVLSTIAHRLVNNVREGDHVGRLGGDEFVVVAEPVSGIDEAVALAERVRAAINAPINVASTSITVGASIGIALASGDELTPDELLRDADLAVYRAKEIGRGGIEICNEDLRKQVAEAADLSVAIRHAIAHDELTLHYQPIIEPGHDTLHAFEALVRWQRPGEDALVPPDKFIGFAERSALIIDLDSWVLDAVARQIAAWTAQGVYDGTPVAVNVSGRHLSHDHFVDHVLDPLRRHGVAPGDIIVEVTESALLDDLSVTATKLQQLRDVGVRIAIDDFGTGYTSLAHLRSLPIDILKIDRSFTASAATNPHEESIVKLIIDTGHLLGVAITAEGIENEAEADMLTSLGSDSLQGFFYSRPQPPADVRFGVARPAANAS